MCEWKDSIDTLKEINSSGVSQHNYFDVQLVGVYYRPYYRL